jgi:hypothetical protein
MEHFDVNLYTCVSYRFQGEMNNLSTSLAGLTTLAKIGRFVFLHREHEGEVKA